MTTQIRDTQFGHLVRFLSRKSILQYPDELDPFLYEETSQTVTAPAAMLTEDMANGHGKTDSRRYVSQHQGSHKVDVKTNPRNWPSHWKVLVALQINLLNFAIYIASSIYVPGEPDVERDFGVSLVVATLGLSLYTVGYGLGPMIWSPLSELPQVGRRGIYFWTLFVYILLQVPTGLATDMPTLLIFRLLTGFFGSPALATGGGTITDLYDPARSAYGIAILGFFGVLGPVFGPLVGGFLAPAKGWRWIIWVVAWLATAVLLLLFFCLPETSEANILYRRAKRLRKATADERLRSQSEIDNAEHTIRDHLLVLGRAFTLTFSEPILFCLDLYTALLYGILFTWFESFPLVFGDVYGFSSGEQGLAFLGILVGGLITLPLFLLWIRYGLIPRFEKPKFRSESVLLPTFFGAATLPICLFWYGWTAREDIPWIVPIVGTGFFTVSIITLFFPVLNYLGMAYTSNVASVFAGNALFRASFGAGFPLFARRLFETLGIGPGNSLLGGIAAGFMAFPVVFYRYGPRLRKMSKNARHD